MRQNKGGAYISGRKRAWFCGRNCSFTSLPARWTPTSTTKSQRSDVTSRESRKDARGETFYFHFSHVSAMPPCHVRSYRMTNRSSFQKYAIIAGFLTAFFTFCTTLFFQFIKTIWKYSYSIEIDENHTRKSKFEVIEKCSWQSKLQIKWLEAGRIFETSVTKIHILFTVLKLH